jgi:hypothetical protein
MVRQLPVFENLENWKCPNGKEAGRWTAARKTMAMLLGPKAMPPKELAEMLAQTRAGTPKNFPENTITNWVTRAVVETAKMLGVKVQDAPSLKAFKAEKQTPSTAGGHRGTKGKRDKQPGAVASETEENAEPCDRDCGSCTAEDCQSRDGERMPE